MELSEDLFSWLSSLHVLSPQAYAVKLSGKRVLDQQSTQALLQATLFRDLLKATLPTRRLDDIPDLSAITETATPAGKLANWSLVFLACAALGIKVEEEKRMLVLAGDHETIGELLYALRQTIVQGVTVRQKKPKVAQDGALFIESIDISRPLRDADSCLEFLLVSFCKHFRISPKQAAGLLTQGNKYLAQIIGRGLKTDFQPVRNWYEDLISSVQTLMQLIVKEAQTGSMALVLSALRPGFLSKDESVLSKCCRLFKTLVPQLTLNSDMCWDWFASQPGGIDACYSAIQRYGPGATPDIVEVLHEAARFKYRDLLVLHLRAQSASVAEYLQVMAEIIPHIMALPQGPERLVEEGIVSELMETGLREADSDGRRPVSVRCSALTFIASIWKHLPKHFDDKEDLVNSMLALFKKGCRDKSQVLSFCSAAHLFDLLGRLFAERSTYAPLIFKSLTFLLIETFGTTAMKEFIMNNFILTLEEIQSLPVATLVEPLVKQLNLDPSLNSVDFDFFIAIARHPRLALEHAIMLSDVAGKQFLGQLHLAKAAGVPLVLLAKRFLQSDVMQEFLYRFLKLSVGIVTQAEKEKKQLPKKLPLYNNRPVVIGNPVTGEEMMEEVSNLHRKKLVCDLLSKVIKLENPEMNDRLRNMLITSLVDLRRNKTEYNKGLMKVLGLLGNAAELLASRETSIQPAVKSPERRLPKRLAILAEPLGKQSPNQMQLALVKSSQDRQYPPQLSKSEMDHRKQVLEHQRQVMKSVWEKKLESNRSGEPPSISHPLLDRQLELVKVKELDYEQEDLENLKTVLKMYSRLLKQLFRSYCGSSYIKGSADVVDTFEQKGAKTAHIREAECFRLLKENGISSGNIHKDQFSSLLKSYCVKNRTPESNAVDYLGFLDIFVQVALFIFSHPPIDLSYLPPAAAFLSLLDLIRNHWKAKGKALTLFDAPYLVRGDRDLLLQLNAEIVKNPDMEIPEGFKKSVGREIELRYDMPSETGLKESYRVAMTTLDELMHETFGLHFLEPRLLARSMVHVEAKGFKANNPNTSTGETRPALPATLHRNPTMKFEMVKLQKKYAKDDLQEVARLLDDLISSVESGLEALMRRGNSGKIQNRALYLREMKEKQLSQDRERAEMKRKQRANEIEEMLLQAKEAKRKKMRKERHKKKKEEKERMELDGKLQERRKKEAEVKARLLAEWTSKKQSVEEERKRAENDRQQETEQAKKLARQQFMKVAQTRLTQIIKQKTLARKQEEAKAEEDAKYLEERKEFDRRKAAELIEIERQRRDQERQMKQEFSALSESGEIAQVIGEYGKALDTLYDNYTKVGAKDPRAASLLLLPGLNKFCLQFYLLPEIISPEELTVLYRMYTKDKSCESGQTIGMDKSEFFDCIIRIAALGQGKFRSLEEEEQFSIAACNAQTIRLLFRYMELPMESKKVLDLLKEINTQPPMHPRDRKRVIKGEDLDRKIEKFRSKQDVRVSMLILVFVKWTKAGTHPHRMYLWFHRRR